MKKLIILLSAVLISGSTEITDTYSHWEEAITAYNQKYFREKVYVNADKTLYFPGETIWFSGFVFNALNNTASNHSEVLYVEIIAPNGSTAETLILPVTAGVARGSWEIRPELPGGRYTLRAFTHWMKNYSPEDYFTREIPVQKATISSLLMRLDYTRDGYGPGDSVTVTLDLRDLNDLVISDANLSYVVRISGSKALSGSGTTDANGQARLRFILPDTLENSDGILEIAVRHAGIFETITRSIPIRLNRVDLRFFTEGGTWAAGVRQRIGFKAVDAFGDGTDVSGEVRDEEGNLITTFSSIHKGMGSFEMAGETDKLYHAVIVSDNRAETFRLPQPSNDTYQLRISDTGKHSVAFDITVPFSDSVMLMGRSFGRIAASKRLFLEAGTHQVTLPLNNFSSGVGVFTLFDNLGLPVCERLWFVSNEDQLDIKISTDDESYLPGEKVTMTVHTSVNGEPVPAQLSLRVVDEALLEMVDDKQDHLLSYMLLSSEIRGTIEEPVYYFDTTKTERLEALDNLLLTQGWRRYTWKEIVGKRSLPHAPEKITRISGTLRKHGKPVSGVVRLIELNENRRILEVRARDDGWFAFLNTDPGGMYLLATDAEYELNLDQKDRIRKMTRRTEVGFAPGSSLLEEYSLSRAEVPAEENTQVVMDMEMESDVTALSEVVVTGYGMESISQLTGSVVSIYGNGIAGSSDLVRILQGRAAGVQVTQNEPVSPAVRIRGLSSLSQTGPLIVIDGVPAGPGSSGNLSPLSQLNPSSIETITVLKGADATSQYGSAALAGVIFITTRSGLSHGHRSNISQRERFSTTTVNPHQFSPVKEFYQPAPSEKGSPREHFETTLFWDPVIITDKNGYASFSFHTNDALTLYKITAEGFSPSGHLGIGIHRFRSTLPVSAKVELPEYVGLEDTLRLPVRLQNRTSSQQTVTVNLAFPDTALVTKGASLRTVIIEPGMENPIFFELATRQRTGSVPLEVTVRSEEYTDVIRDSMTIRPVGIPQHQSYVSTTKDTVFNLPPKSVEGNTHRVEVNIYTNLLADLFSGAESLLNEPHGCFEQVSSTTFPNILALQYMKASNTLQPDVGNKAHEFLESGFRKLKAYEIRGGGFEWFGHPPAHEGLTAFGLIEFHEMNKVHPLSDPEIIDRTRNWLLSRRDGAGGFKQAHGKYGFTGAKPEVTNAYIVYALSATGTVQNILPEYEHALREAWASKDMYRMALMANAAHYLNRDRDYERLTGWYRFVTGEQGYQGWQADHSIVRSYGPSLETETLAFWTLALLHRPVNLLDVRENVDQLLKHRNNARFGNSQATTVALMALTKFAELATETQSDGEVVVLVNGQEVRRTPYSPGQNKTIRVKGLEDYLDHDKKNTVRLRVETKGKSVPVSLRRSWSSLKPDARGKARVRFMTMLASDTVELRRTVRLSVVVQNEANEALPMTLVRVKIPAGLELQVWQLRELQEEGIYDYYEIVDNELYLYFTELGGPSEVVVPLDLKAIVPGRFRAGASSAYLYYADDVKSWVKGEEVIVQVGD